MNSNLKILFCAQLLGAFSFITPVITLFYLHRGLSFFNILVLLIVYSVASFIFEFPAHIFKHKFGDKVSVIISQVFQILFITILIFAYSKLMFYFAAALFGICSVFKSGSLDSIISNSTTNKKNLSSNIKKIKLASIIPTIFSVLIGAYIAGNLINSQFLIILFTTVVFALIKLILLLFFLKNENVPKQTHNKDQKHFLVKFKQGVNCLKNNPYFFLMFLSTLLITTPFFVFLQYAQIALIKANVPVIIIGFFYAAAIGTQALTLYLSSYFKSIIHPKSALISSGICFFILFVLIASFLNQKSFLFIIFTGLFFVHTLRNIFWIQEKNNYIPVQDKKVVSSILSLFNNIFRIIVICILLFFIEYQLFAMLIVSSIIVFIGLLFPIKIFEKSSNAKS